MTLGLNSAHSQSSPNLGFNWHRGYLVAHRPLVEGLRLNRINGFDISIGKRVSGKQDWHWEYGMPNTGIYFGIWDLGNKHQLGYSYSVIPYVDFSIHEGRVARLGLKFGWGIGVVENKFDAETNYKNVAIGSRVNNSILLHPTVGIKIAHAHSIKFGLSLTHYSNGSFETPNLGINVASATLGYSFQFNQDTIARKEPVELKRSRSDFLFGSFFSKEVAPADGDKYAVATLFAERMWQTTNKFSFGGGIDIFFDKSLSQRSNYQEEDGVLGLIRAGVHGGTEMHLGNTSIVLGIGSYLYSGIRSESVYHRFGIRQKLNPRWSACLHVKSHWAKADFMEIGIGRTFNRR